jgi:hypothetical protein
MWSRINLQRQKKSHEYVYINKTRTSFVKHKQYFRRDEGRRGRSKSLKIRAYKYGSWESSVDTVTRLWSGLPRVWSSIPSRGKIFLFSAASRLALGPIQPPIQRVQAALPWGIKWSGHKGEQSRPSSAEVSNMCTYASIHHTSSWHYA